MISDCAVPEFQQTLCDKTNLRSLVLNSGPRLPSAWFTLPQGIARWRTIFRLELRRCGLQSLPDSIGAFGPTLRELDISDNTALVVLPAAFSQLSGLTFLDVSGLAAVVSKADPLAVGSLRWICDSLLQLETLKIAKCALQQVSAFLFLSHACSPRLCCCCQSLSLPRSRLSAIFRPLSVLAQLPDNFARLQRLSVLHIPDNQLQTFPEIVFTLPRFSRVIMVGSLRTEQTELPVALVTCISRCVGALVHPWLSP